MGASRHRDISLAKALYERRLKRICTLRPGTHDRTEYHQDFVSPQYDLFLQRSGTSELCLGTCRRIWLLRRELKGVERSMPQPYSGSPALRTPST